MATKRAKKSKDAAPHQQLTEAGRQRPMQPQPETIRAGYRGSGKLDGKVALVTGGDSGIGRSAAVHFAREGADVAILYLDEDQDARDTERMILAEGRRCLLVRGDARSEARCRRAVEQTVAKLGALNVLVNNLADHVSTDRLEDISASQLRTTFETNVYPYFFVTRFALEHMRAGDCIINTGSVTSFRGSEHLLDYASTKGAIETFTYSLAQNLVKRGIRVNGVAPGPIWTPLSPRPTTGKSRRNSAATRPWAAPGSRANSGRPTCSWPARTAAT